MRRRSLLITSLAAFGLTAFGGLTSCGSPDTPAGPPLPPDPRPAAATFAARLMGALLLPGQNHLSSPASILLALGLLRPGASGTVAEELDEVLGVSGREEWEAWAEQTIETLGSRSGTFTEAEVTKQVTLRIAQAAFAAVGLQLKPDYVASITERLDATVAEVDFTRPDDAAHTINQWADEHTDGQIDQILDAGQIDPGTVLMLANALHLAAHWRREMAIEPTPSTPFIREDGSVVNVRMMSDTVNGWYADEQMDAALIPFVGERLAMAVALPRTSDWAALMTDWADGGLDAMLSGFDLGQPISLSMPSWTMDWSDNLNKALMELGLGSLFRAAGDLSGIADGGISVDQVVHRAVMAVDEYGVVASAVTAIAIATSAPVEPKELRLDRPFAFVIFDTETRLPLFIGRLSDPH